MTRLRWKTAALVRHPFGPPPVSGLTNERGQLAMGSLSFAGFDNHNGARPDHRGLSSGTPLPPMGASNQGSHHCKDPPMSAG